jgi:hypothetical protein
MSGPFNLCIPTFTGPQNCLSLGFHAAAILGDFERFRAILSSFRRLSDSRLCTVPQIGVY